MITAGGVFDHAETFSRRRELNPQFGKTPFGGSWKTEA
jgi:hypothetical protein